MKELLRAVEHDECPTAILADWLEEHGDPRAAAVRERGPLAVLAMLAPDGRCPMKRIPHGSFWMSEDGKNAVKQVEIPTDFYLGVFPVTQGQWEAVMGKNPSWFSRGNWGKDKVKRISDADLKLFPVECVSWFDARLFLAKLNRRAPDSGWAYRLPTEAQWELACRNGATSKEDCSFKYYLDQPTNRLTVRQGNFGARPGRTCRVGRYPPNRLGLYDMHGNVWEWCADKWNPVGSHHVMRGDSWGSHAGSCAAAQRGSMQSVQRYLGLGFRLARVSLANVAGE